MTTSDEWAKKLGLSHSLTPSQQAFANMRVQNPTRKPRTVDPMVFDLASSFLDDANDSNYGVFSKLDKQELAELIQDLIEDYMRQVERDRGAEGETP